MVSLAEMKSQLVELEDKKNKLQEEFQKASQRFKMSLWGIGIGVVLLPCFIGRASRCCWLRGSWRFSILPKNPALRINWKASKLRSINWKFPWLD